MGDAISYAYMIPLANLGVLVGIYIQVSRVAARLGAVEAWKDAHDKQDDERHQESCREHDRLWNRIGRWGGRQGRDDRDLR